MTKIRIQARGDCCKDTRRANYKYEGNGCSRVGKHQKRA